MIDVALISPEVSATLTPVLIGLGLAFAGTAAAWLARQKAKWDYDTAIMKGMIEEAINKSQEAAQGVNINRQLIMENTNITKEAAKNTNGVLFDLKQKAERANEMRTKMRERIAESAQSSLKDDLDQIDQEYQHKEEKIMQHQRKEHEGG